MPPSDESSRLQILRKLLSANLPTPIRPIVSSVNDQDDAALILISDNTCLAVSSDFVRGPQFYLAELGYLGPRDLGYYLVVANLSDLAAMGARPIGITTVVRYERTMSDEYFTDLFLGMKMAADEHGTQIVGGDIGEYKSPVLTATAMGLVDTDKALRRGGSRRGDLLCVTGTIGRAITALLYFKDWKQKGFYLSPNEEELLLESWRRPPARLLFGAFLADNDLASACQDISDGLKATIDQLTEASGLTFTVDASQLPVTESTRKLASFIGCDPVGIAASASVDFELLFTASEEQVIALQSSIGAFDTTFHVIGRVNESQSNLLRQSNGQEVPFPGIAWKQQTNDYLKDIAAGAKNG